MMSITFSTILALQLFSHRMVEQDIYSQINFHTLTATVDVNDFQSLLKRRGRNRAN